MNILNSLCDDYLSGKDEDEILKHGCFHKPEEMGADESLIWGNMAKKLIDMAKEASADQIVP